MKKWNLMSGILLFAIGLLVIIFPQFWLNVVVVMLGIGAIVYGIYNLKFVKAISENNYYNKTILLRGIISIIIGLIVIFFPWVPSALWGVIIWVLIIYLIASSIMGFYAAALLKNTGINRKKYVIENIGLLVLAIVLILITPQKLGESLMRIVGIITLILGVAIAAFAIFAIVREKNDVVATVEVSDSDVVVKDDEPVAIEDGNDNEETTVEPEADDAEEKPVESEKKSKRKTKK